MGHCFLRALGIPCMLCNFLFVRSCDSIGRPRSGSHTCDLSDLYTENST